MPFKLLGLPNATKRMIRCGSTNNFSACVLLDVCASQSCGEVPRIWLMEFPRRPIAALGLVGLIARQKACLGDFHLHILTALGEQSNSN